MNLLINRRLRASIIILRYLNVRSLFIGNYTRIRPRKHIIFIILSYKIYSVSDAQMHSVHARTDTIVAGSNPNKILLCVSRRNIINNRCKIQYYNERL